MNLPNLITICRVFLVPVVVWLIITDHMLIAFWTFLVAGISDGIDGFIAKRFAQQTVLGAYLDPLADKALLVSIYIALGLNNHIPNWLVIMVVSRDILIIAAVILSWMLDRAIRMSPLFVSKANTTGQIMLAALVLFDLGFALDLTLTRQVMIIAVAVLTVASATVYLVRWLDHMASYEEAPAQPAAPRKTAGQTAAHDERARAETRP